VDEYDWKTNLGVMEPIPTGQMPRGRIDTRLHALICDIYGTLFISGSGDIGVAARRFGRTDALTELGRCFRIPWTPSEITQRLVNAIRHRHALDRRAGVDHPEIQIDRLWQEILGWPELEQVRRFAVAYEHIVNPTYPMPGLDQILRTLRRRQIPLGIISNAQFFTPSLFTTYLGAEPQNIGFDADLILYSFEFGQAKPSVALFQQLADRLQSRGISPASVLYVGNDIGNDICPARDTGFKTALFAGDQRSLRLRGDADRYRAITPDITITALSQLLDLDWRTINPHGTRLQVAERLKWEAGGT
jgi:putative hydrolase of the HAD superfamily